MLPSACVSMEVVVAFSVAMTSEARLPNGRLSLELVSRLRRFVNGESATINCFDFRGTCHVVPVSESPDSRPVSLLKGLAGDLFGMILLVKDKRSKGCVSSRLGIGGVSKNFNFQSLRCFMKESAE